MTASTDYNYSYFDALIKQNRSFSVYRKPGANSTSFAMQREGTPEYLRHLSALNGKNGFVIAPFEVSANTPIVLLHPDIFIEGDENIRNFLHKNYLCAPSVNEVESTVTNYFPTYQKAFELFQSALRSNACEKIVLSRALDKTMPDDFSAAKTFKAACEAYPEAFVYLSHTSKTGTWFGCSPELILSGGKERWQTVALAGTKKISADNAPIHWDEKNIREQHIVADYLEKQLNSIHLTCTKSGPYTARAGKLMHLKTEFDFQMNQSNQIGTLLDILHPTPAVCGFPKEKALRLILDKEGYDRKYYSGFIGELSMKGCTNLYVNLRCLQIKRDILTFYAGGGLLASSDMESEWKETEAKMQTMLSLINFKKETNL